MNTDQVKGKWDQIKGKAKKAWGELTDNDFKKAEGSEEKLYGVIQEKFGDTKEVIKEKLDKLHLEIPKTGDTAAKRQPSATTETETGTCCG